MTAYATPADMVAEFGERELIALTDLRDLGVVDTAKAQKHLDDAAVLIDAHLLRRYPAPAARIHALTKTVCMDIARYRMSGAETLETNPVRARYKDAIKILESIRDGEIDLGAALASGDGEADPVISMDRVSTITGHTAFAASQIADYLG